LSRFDFVILLKNFVCFRFGFDGDTSAACVAYPGVWAKTDNRSTLPQAFLKYLSNSAAVRDRQVESETSAAGCVEKAAPVLSVVVCGQKPLSCRLGLRKLCTILPDERR
jgi:hypothetical protein